MTTGNVIAASQDPLALNDIRLSDASGNEFKLVIPTGGMIDLNVLGGTSASYINIAVANNLLYKQGLTSDPLNDIQNIDTINALINRKGVSVGEAFMVEERANGIFRARTGLTGNGRDIIQSSTDASIQYYLDDNQYGVIRAKMFGAAEDGVTDDTVLINAALARFQQVAVLDAVYTTSLLAFQTNGSFSE